MGDPVVRLQDRSPTGPQSFRTTVAGLFGIVAVLALALLGGRAMLPAASVVAAGAATVGFWRRRAQAQSRRAAQSIATLESLVRHLRVGRTFPDALRSVRDESAESPLGRAIGHALADVEAGRALEAALRASRRRHPHIDNRVWTVLLAATALGERAGSRGLAAFADRAVTGLVDHDRAASEAAVLAAQALLSMRVMVALPVVVVLPQLLRFEASPLWSSGTGRVCLAVGIALELVGWCWMQALGHRAMR